MVEEINKNMFNDKTAVNEDRLWRSNVDKTYYAAKNWPEKWGFLQKFEDMVREESKKSKKKLNIDILNKNKIPNKIVSIQIVEHELVKSIPKTTSAMIGWRSTNKILQLEKYGSCARGKSTLTRSLQWPEESCE